MTTLKISTDFSIICRCCLSQNLPLTVINEENVKEAYTQFTNLKINSQDRLPKKICLICLNTFQNMLNFIQKCKSSDSILRMVLKEMDLAGILENSNKDALSTVESVQSYYENFLEVVEIGSSNEETHLEYESTDDGHSEVQLNSNGNRILEACHKCECCGAHFVAHNLLWDHLKQNKTCMEKRFKCPTCSKTFSIGYRLKAHMESHIEEPRFQCNICSKALKSSRSLLRHKTIHEVEETTDDITQRETQVNEKCLCKKYPRCNHCSEKFRGLKELMEHYNQNENCWKNRFKCPLCSKAFCQRQRLKKHIITHREGPFQCNTCSKLFKFSHNLLKHQNIHKEEEIERMAENETHVNEKCPLRKPPECTYCGEKFCDTKELMEHFKQNENCLKNRFQCHICSKGFAVKSKMKTHMSSHTKETPFKCEICSRAFRYTTTLYRHLKMHEGNRRRICRICGKGFYGEAAMDAHLQTHTDGSVFTCKYCGRNFATYQSHRRHIIGHEAPERLKHKVSRPKGLEQARPKGLEQGVPEFLCHLCGKQCKSKVTLDVHLRSHSGIKPYKCSYCDKSFGHQSSLASHILLHTGRRPFTCNICDKSFVQSPHLKSHMRTHTGEKPYVCSFCKRAFSFKGSLTAHVRIHTGVKPYQCSICQLKFRESSALKKHKKRHEKVVYYRESSDSE